MCDIGNSIIQKYGEKNDDLSEMMIHEEEEEEEEIIEEEMEENTDMNKNMNKNKSIPSSENEKKGYNHTREKKEIV